MITHQDIVRHNIAETLRVWREGGAGRVVLPGNHPNEVTIVEIDHRTADEAISHYLDVCIDDIKRRAFESHPLPIRERRILKLWLEKASHTYSWMTMPDSRHFLLLVNAHYSYLGAPPVRIELADHPAAYDLNWSVPEPTPGRDDPRYSFGSIRVHEDDRGRLPLFSTWTRLEHLNDDKWVERQRRGIPAPPPLDEEALALWRESNSFRQRRRKVASRGW